MPRNSRSSGSALTNLQGANLSLPRDASDFALARDHQPILRTSTRGINDFTSFDEIRPGNFAKQLAAPHAVASRIAASPEICLTAATANPATVASPEPTVEIGCRWGGRANHAGPFLPSSQTRPLAPREIAALLTPRPINSLAALRIAA
jgi:hypothetical protein